MKERIFVDMDGVLAAYKPAATKEETEFLSFEPVEGAVAAYTALCECYDVYILSTSPWSNPQAACDKHLWVKEHLGELAYKRVILTHHKNLLAGKALIDDRTANGAGDFQGEHIHFGTEHFPNWEIVLNYLLG